ncbi:MAG: hypothetical protein HFG24_02000 [Anaerotruncus sp.]|nr:hypothetical protein [Anaerotruncus sp.]
MKTVYFNAVCPFEIGDYIRDMGGRIHKITDIACVHRVRTGKVEFRFELDNSGRLIMPEPSTGSKTR